MLRDLQDADDAILVQKTIKGDAAAWGQIVEKYGPYVHSILRSTRISEADQADAFQYVFVELFRAIPTLKNTDILGPWIKQTALRHAIKLRKAAARTEGLPEAELPSEEDFSVEIEAVEISQMVRDAVRGLADQCRKLIVMLFFEDPVRPYAEVASELGISVGSIGNTRIRCLDILQRALKKRGIE